MSDRDAALALREQSLDDTIVAVSVPNPAAGTDVSAVTVPGGQVWRLIAYTAKITAQTSATFASMVYTDGTTVAARASTNFAVAVGVSVTVSFFLGSSQVGLNATGDMIMGALPPIPLLAGWTFQVQSTLLGATAQWSAVSYCYERLDSGVLGRYGGLAAAAATEDDMWDHARWAARQAT